ncbi:Ubiquitin-associated and SH3 domain-containing protein [Trichinella pseudospiralis]
MIKNVPSYFPPELRTEDNEDANIWPSYLAEKRIQFLGSTTRDAGINVTDVICAPSLQLINLANSFIEGYESKLEKKDKVLEIKIDGGFSESIQYYYVHEKLKANFIKCGYPIDRAHETSYKCPENCNNEFSHLHFREVEKDAGEWKFQSMPMAEKKSRVMGAASYKSCFNITDVISAPSTKCILAADSFIKGFESGQQDTTNPLKIKVEAALSKSVEGYHSHKHFQLLAIERGYRVDDSYETCAQRSGNSEVDPFRGKNGRCVCGQTFGKRTETRS